MVKIRLRRTGKKNAPCYRLVVADSRSPRDGRFIETLGMYDPISGKEEVKLDRVDYWLSVGAQSTKVASSIIRRLKNDEEAKPSLKSIIRDAKAKAKPKEEAEVKEEAKPEAKAEAKEEAKPEAKAEVKEEAKPEAKAEAKEEVKPEAKAEAKEEVKPEAKAEVKEEVKPEAKAEVKEEVKPEAKDEAKEEN